MGGKNRPKKKITRVRLFTNEGSDRWGGGFDNTIYLEMDADGSLTMYALNYFEDEEEDLDRVSGIKSVDEFEEAYSRISMVVDTDGLNDDIFDRVALLDNELANGLRKKLNTEEDETDESTDEADE